MANELKTYGDLKKAIKSISLKQKGEKIGGLAADTLAGFIPGLDVAKTTFDFIKAAISKPDSKKTKTWLDKLDIDDQTSKIVDDTVENSFMQTIAKSVESQPDDKALEPDFNMNQKLVDFIKNNYKGRTVTGIKENNMKKELLKKIIKEEINKLKQEATLPANQPAVKQTAATKQYATATKTATAIGAKANQLKSINDLPGAFETWFSSLGLKDQSGISQSIILSKIKDTLIKMGIK
jgi:arsenate reductase-like glutaredoxin family protein